MDIAYGIGISNREKLRLLLKPYISSSIVEFVELPKQSACRIAKHNRTFQDMYKTSTQNRAFIDYIHPY